MYSKLFFGRDYFKGAIKSKENQRYVFKTRMKKT